MTLFRRLRTIAALIAVCLAGGVTAVAVASGGSALQGTTGTTTTDDDSSTGTTGETTTGETTTGTTNTTTTPSGVRRAPRIIEIEVDSVSNGRLRLRAEVVRRSSRITKVRFTYRGVKYTAIRRSSGNWTRVVTARGGDSRGDTITFRVTACSGSRCVSRVGSDEAGGGGNGGGNDNSGGSGDDDGTPDQGSGDN
jgi:hypothetical protein